jgi:hypothetical protein
MNSIKKIIFWFVLVSAFLTIGYYVYMAILFTKYQRKADNKAFENWYNNVFLLEDYKGDILQIKINENCNSILRVYENKTYYGYNICLCDNEEMKDFIAEGDSVFKNKGEFELTFKKLDGTKKTFELPFCD